MCLIHFSRILLCMWCSHIILARWAIIIVSLCTHEYVRSHSTQPLHMGQKMQITRWHWLLRLFALTVHFSVAEVDYCVGEPVCSTFVSCGHQSSTINHRHRIAAITHFPWFNCVCSYLSFVKMHKDHLISALNSIDFGLNEINRPL